MSDEESDSFIPSAGSVGSKVIQRQMRSVHLMNAVSMLLGCAAIGMMAVVMLRPATPSHATGISPESLVGLSEAPTPSIRGWYRTYLDSQVREQEAVDSAEMTVLSAHSLVFVVEARGHSARILKPVKGWVSLVDEDGVEVFRPDATYQASPDKADIEAVFRSREVQEANERLQQSAAKLTQVEKNLLDALKKLEKLPKKVQEKWPKIEQQASKAGEKLAGHIDKAAKPDTAEKLVNHLTNSKPVGKAVKDTPLEDLLRKAHEEVKAAKQHDKNAEALEQSVKAATRAAGQLAGQAAKGVAQKAKAAVSI